MSSPRRRVVVELRPGSSTSSTPSSPTKAVRFPDQTKIIMGVSRPLSRTEVWSLYYYESHARTCSTCFEMPNTGRLCETGQDLAKDVNEHVYHREGQIYSRIREDARDIRVELPPEYDCLTALLRAMDRNRSRRREQRSAPIISYDKPLSKRSSVVQAYALPGDSRKDKSIRYNTIVVGEDDDNDRSGPPFTMQKRGSLYADEKYPPRPKEYRIELIEPSNARRKVRRKGAQF